MLPVVYSIPAERDLDAIALGLGEENPAAAYDLLRRIDDTMFLIASFPQIGESVDRYGEDIRRTIVTPYLVYYRLRPDRVELVRVIHGSRDIQHLDE